MIELGSRGDKGGRSVHQTLIGVVRNPLVLATMAGVLAARVWPSGLPPLLNALTKQVIFKK